MGQTVPVIGAVIIAIVLVIVIPVTVIISGAVAAGILGWSLKKDRDDAFEGTEYLEIS